MIGSQESEATGWFEVPVPPRFDNSDHLTIEKKENGSVVIVMNNNDRNHRCKVRYLDSYEVCYEHKYLQVKEYHVKYEGEESFIDPASLQDGKLWLNVKSENAKIDARIKYAGFEDWTDWISSDKPVSLFFIF